MVEALRAAVLPRTVEVIGTRRDRLADLRTLAAAGFSKSEAARILRVTRPAVHQLAVAHGVSFPEGQRGRPSKGGSPDDAEREPTAGVHWASVALDLGYELQAANKQLHEVRHEAAEKTYALRQAITERDAAQQRVEALEAELQEIATGPWTAATLRGRARAILGGADG